MNLLARMPLTYGDLRRRAFNAVLERVRWQKESVQFSAVGGGVLFDFGRLADVADGEWGEEHLDEALSEIGSGGWVIEEASFLVSVAPIAKRFGRSAVIAQAFLTVMRIEDDKQRATDLIGLIPYLDGEQQQRALQEVKRVSNCIDEEHFHVHVHLSLARFLGKDEHKRAVELARERFRNLVLGQQLELLRSCELGFTRAQCCAEVRRIFVQACQITGQSDRDVGLFARLTNELCTDDERRVAISAMLDMASHSQRGSFFNALDIAAPMLFRVGGEDLLEACVRGVLDVREFWP